MAINSIFYKLLKDEAEQILELSKYQLSFKEVGKISVAELKSFSCTVQFLYGPPEFHIEMIIYTEKKKYEFKDLLEIPSISSWVKHNKYIKENKNYLNSELLWFINLLKFALHIVLC